MSPLTILSEDSALNMVSLTFRRLASAPAMPLRWLLISFANGTILINITKNNPRLAMPKLKYITTRYNTMNTPQKNIGSIIPSEKALTDRNSETDDHTM